MYNKLKNIIPHKIKFDNFQARLLEEKDISILQNFFENNSEFFTVSNVNGVSKNEAENLIKQFLAHNNEKFIIGTFDEKNNLINIIELTKINNSQEFEVNKYIVDKNERGRGVARTALRLLEELMMAIGCKNLTAVIKEQNLCVLEFFRKLGYEEKSKSEQNENPGKFTFTLVKKLEKKQPTLQDKCFKNGKLVFFPSKVEEKLEIYKIMQSWFEKGKKYSEMELNNLIKSKIECSDHVTLRRDMVDNKFINRSSDGKEYWI